MPVRITRALAALVLLATLAACAAARHTGEEQPRTWLRVENQNFLDMTVYVLRSSQRVRLGTATGNSTTRLVIPPSLLFGATPLRFQADPIGGSATPVSMEITVSPGDEVTIRIPPR